MQKSDDQLIIDFKNRDEESLAYFYKVNYQPFFSFASRYQLQEAELQDIYQDAIIAVYENALKGKLDVLQAKLSTYLFSVAKYMIYKRKKDFENKNFDDLVIDIKIDIDENQEDNLLTNQLIAAFSKLGQQCQEVLRLFYYEEKKLDEIAVILNYSNKDVLKSQKSRCLKKLKEILSNEK